MSCNISFTSRIKFVDPSSFQEMLKGKYIGYQHCEKNYELGSSFFTEEVRSCTAGGIVGKNGKGALGFHYLDDLENNENAENFALSLLSKLPDSERGLIFGAKQLLCAPYSLSIFSKIKRVFEEHIPNLTILEQHKLPWSETHATYNILQDKWVLCTIFKNQFSGKEKYVKTLDDLCANFKQIRLANGDSLFIGDKRIEL